jgi:hypothetical protein
MKREERRELQAIAYFLRSLDVRWPTDPLQIVLQLGFIEWALAVLEGRDPKGRPGRDWKETREGFVKLTKQFKTAQAKLVTEGKEDPSSTAIFQRMSESHFPPVAPDSLRKDWDSIKHELAKKLAGKPTFDAAFKETLAQVETVVTEVGSQGGAKIGTIMGEAVLPVHALISAAILGKNASA